MRTTNTQTLRTGKAARDRGKLPAVLSRKRRRNAANGAARTFEEIACACENISPAAPADDLRKLLRNIRRVALAERNKYAPPVVHVPKGPRTTLPCEKCGTLTTIKVKTCGGRIAAWCGCRN